MTGSVPAYDVAWSGPARRALRTMPEKVGTAVVEFAYGPLAGSPYQVGRPLRFELEGRYSARRGDYRIVYRIDEDEHLVVVEAVEHRADVYRPRG